jgi:long-chain fatty acid transport protein
MRSSKLMVATFLGAIASGPAFAGGIYIAEEACGSDIGYGGISFNARANDACTVFNNPAGMSRFDKAETFVGGTLLYLKAPFSKGSDNTVSGKSGQATEFVPLGNAAHVRPLNDKLDWVGTEV